MNLTERAILDLAETWYHRWHTEDGGDSFTDLYQAISAWKNEQCGVPVAMSAMWDDLQAQVDAEAKTRTERGEHLIDVFMYEPDGEEREYQYLESNAP